MILGIDFGTTYSCVACYFGGKSDILELSDFKFSTYCGERSLYFCDENSGAEACGNECLVYQGGVDERVVKNLKQMIRKNITDSKAIYVVHKYLKFLFDKANEKIEELDISNKKIEYITITVPCGTGNEHDSTASAYNAFIKNEIMKISKLDESHVHILEEPKAAALSYLDSVDDVNKICVFDLGGGTLDISILERNSEGEYNVISSSGNLNLGGNNWDDAFYAYVLKKYNLTDDSFNDINRDRLKYELIIAKHNLNSILNRKKLLNSSSTEQIPPQHVHVLDKYGKSHTFEVSLEEFDNATKTLLNEAIRLLKNINEIDRVDKIVLSGGGSNMIQIVKEISREFSQLSTNKKIILFDPSFAIAKGAAIYSDMKLEELKNNGVTENHFNDIATHSYGIKSFTDKENKINGITNLIFKGTSFINGLISTNNKDFSPTEEDQKIITFTAYESDIMDKRINCDPDKDDRFKKKNISVTIKIPDELVKSKQSLSFYCHLQMTLSDDQILTLKVYDKDYHLFKESSGSV